MGTDMECSWAHVQVLRTRVLGSVSRAQCQNHPYLIPDQVLNSRQRRYPVCSTRVTMVARVATEGWHMVRRYIRLAPHDMSGGIHLGDV
jgi:hypothetical protein